MSSDLIIDVNDVSKTYLIYDKPENRLKQMVVPRLRSIAGLSPVQYFREFPAVRHTSFQVGRGETVGIVGRNGSGKSTLLEMICGTLQPSGGTINVHGRIAALLELGSGFNPDFTGRENVYLNAAILGLSRAETERRFSQIAEFAGIGDFMDQPVKTYSSGMYVRLAFSVATNVDPDILIVDEALAVGDEAFQRKCFARIEQIKERGCTILFVSHSPQSVIQLCDRAILMDRGEKIMEGSPKIVVNHYQRMVNLSGDDAEAVREKIKTLDGWTVTAEDEGDEPDGELKAEAEAEKSGEQAWFDPSLKSESRVEYEADGARISNIRLLDQQGRRVNHLVPNETYNFVYDVHFDANVSHVGFAMYIKTVHGVELAGQTSHPAGEGASFEAGDFVTVSFPFDCHLLSGAYVANCGVYVNGKGEFIQLHRILDALMFRVSTSNPNFRRMGLVDLQSHDEPCVIQHHKLKHTA
ncbi:ABC transporter ATP-binding protein [Hyphomonas atlantica corrig.]|uniref:ABC transporter ATP-binding protein n=1 Tax=Hyphomonas atlantica TaxID=1280948 RepID=UPI002356512F|nr:ABC transporter ATP-binding protein [Hyphomonas atlantica]